MPKKSVAGTSLDPIMQFATLTIDDRPYKLVYDFNAIAKAEGVTGCNLLNGLLSLENLSAVHLIGLLYAALSVAHPDITVTGAGDLVRLDTIPTITQALAEAYALSMPQKKTAAIEPSEQAA